MHSVFRSAKTNKFRFEEGNSARYFRKHSVDRFMNNLSVCSLATLKSKFNSDLRLHVHSRATTETIEGYPSEYCTVFYLSMFDSLNQYLFRQRNLEQSPSRVDGNSDTFDVTNEENNLNKTMFIGVINVSEKRQCTIHCLIRLQTLDCCPLSIGQSFNGILADVPGCIFFEETFVIPDGEFDVLGKQMVLKKPKLPKQIVKGRPQVVANIANEQGKYGRNVFQLLKPEQALSCLSLSYKVSDDLIGLTIEEPLHQVISDLEVFISSAEFEERAIQRVHNLTPIIEAMIDATLNISYHRVKRLEGKVDGKERRAVVENGVCGVN